MMYTVRIGEQDFPVNDLPTLQAMMQAGRINAATWVYDHAAGNWRAAGEILAATPPVDAPSAAPIAPGTQKTTPTMAVLSLIFGIIGFFIFIIPGIISIVLGFMARRRIDRNPELYQGRGLATSGIIMGLFQTIAVPGCIVLIMTPSYLSIQIKAHNAAAQNAGYNAKIAQELEYQNTNAGEPGSGKYADNLGTLLVWDRNLTDDPQVTFAFGSCDAQGYTFTTTHARGDELYKYID
ncbi:MAG TPA: DUF4190 domain-containing protein [bacterium]|nr:DUF4190 domain-containing protein [bacterium]